MKSSENHEINNRQRVHTLSGSVLVHQILIGGGVGLGVSVGVGVTEMVYHLRCIYLIRVQGGHFILAAAAASTPNVPHYLRHSYPPSFGSKLTKGQGQWAKKS